jgi:hypothetical protein
VSELQEIRMKPKIAAGILAVVGIVAMANPGILGVRAGQDDSTDLKTHTATGCLMKSPVTNTYTITDENGKLWDLRSDSVPLNAHVGHTVTVSGTIPKQPKDSTDTSPQNHLVVTKLEMVRDSCKQP